MTYFWKNSDGKTVCAHAGLILGEDGNFYQMGKFFDDGVLRTTAYAVDPKEAYKTLLKRAKEMK